MKEKSLTEKPTTKKQAEAKPRARAGRTDPGRHYPPARLQKLFERAHAEYQAGQLDLAEASFREVLAHSPRLWGSNTYLMLALCLLASGQPAKMREGARHLRSILKHVPKHALAMRYLAEYHLTQKQPHLAYGLLKEAIKLAPQDAEVRQQLMDVCHLLEHHKEEALEQLFWLVGNEPAQALRWAGSLIGSLNNLGRFAEALQVLHEWESWEQNPYATQFTRFGVYSGAGMYGLLREEFNAFVGDVRRLPADSNIQISASHSCGDLWRDADSEWLLRQVLARTPEDRGLHFNFACVLLTRGKYREGWREYDWRMKEDAHKRQEQHARFKEPQWMGQRLKNEGVLVYSEQGVGDVLQAMRYLQLAKKRGARVIFEGYPQILSLLRQQDDAKVQTDLSRVDLSYTYQCAVMSLIALFTPTLGKIPAEPYLFASSAKKAHWRGFFTPWHDRFKIGLVWSGNPVFGNDHNRSARLDEFAPLASVAGTQFFSLQKGATEAQALAPPEGLPLIDLAAQIQDYADTAAVIANLDLVITVDTGVAHLAGAMGSAVWMVLPSNNDYRWLRHREDCPWYPTMRIFRQQVGESWPDVFPRVADALGAMLLEDRLVAEEKHYALLRLRRAAYPPPGPDHPRWRQLQAEVHRRKTHEPLLAAITPDPARFRRIGQTLLAQASPLRTGNARTGSTAGVRARPGTEVLHPPTTWDEESSRILVLLAEDLDETRWLYDSLRTAQQALAPDWQLRLLRAQAKDARITSAQWAGCWEQAPTSLVLAARARALLEEDQPEALLAWFATLQADAPSAAIPPGIPMGTAISASPAALAAAQTPAKIAGRFPHPLVLLWQGHAQAQLGHHAAAIDYYRQAQKISPRSPEVALALASALQREGKADDALIHLQQAARTNRRHREVWLALAHLLYSAEGLTRPEFSKHAAETVLTHLHAYYPDDYQINLMLGLLRAELGMDLTDTHRWLRQQLRAHPDDTELRFVQTFIDIEPDAATTSGTGGAHVAAHAETAGSGGKSSPGSRAASKSVARYRKILKLDPRHRDARLALGMELIRLGHYREGWACYEARLEPSALHRDTHSIARLYRNTPRWNGEPLPAGQRLMLHLEQGMGDGIMALRYLDDLCTRVAPGEVVLVGHPDFAPLCARTWPQLRYVPLRFTRLAAEAADTAAAETTAAEAPDPGKKNRLGKQKPVSGKAQRKTTTPATTVRAATIRTGGDTPENIPLAMRTAQDNPLEPPAPASTRLLPELDFSYAAYFESMSLPHQLGLEDRPEPLRYPYLSAPTDAARDDLYEGVPPGRRIGIAWAGNPAHPNDVYRSCPLLALLPLLRMPQFGWFSLQKDRASNQAYYLPPDVPLHNLAIHAHSLDDTARLIAGLDLVICVDTLLAHLAGAMGKPVWILLAARADWRWPCRQQAGESMPWYPSARLFRQNQLQNWPQLVEEVQTALLAGLSAAPTMRFTENVLIR